ncbi:MAG: hypothetical protein A2V98_19765 [Planctomycetes bacterium RBG_16_64_12]|nr:MAG: hypothetical protein A2V98_19765 [Planctomycetes bacterium RBG_16_64_12]
MNPWERDHAFGQDEKKLGAACTLIVVLMDRLHELWGPTVRMNGMQNCLARLRSGNSKPPVGRVMRNTAILYKRSSGWGGIRL